MTNFYTSSKEFKEKVSELVEEMKGIVKEFEIGGGGDSYDS
jgi:hypothetical protein